MNRREFIKGLAGVPVGVALALIPSATLAAPVDQPNGTVRLRLSRVGMPDPTPVDIYIPAIMAAELKSQGLSYANNIVDTRNFTVSVGELIDKPPTDDCEGCY